LGTKIRRSILQDRHLTSLIFVFVYFKVGPNLKYSVFNHIMAGGFRLDKGRLACSRNPTKGVTWIQ